MSASQLASSTHGAAGTWAVSDPESLLTTQTAGQDPANALTGDTSTQGMAYGVSNGADAFIQWTLPSAHNALAFGLWYKTGKPAAWIEGPHFVTLYNAAVGDMLRLSDERSSTTNTREIRVSPLDASVSVADNTWYWCTMEWRQGAAGSFAVYDTSLNLVGSVNFTDTFNAPTQAILLGNTSGTSAEAGETTYFDDLIVEYSNPSFPLLPISPLVSLAVTPSAASIPKGATQQFTATGTLSDGTTVNMTNSVTWASSNGAVASVTAAGLATGAATGSTTIQASSGSISGSAGLTVTTQVLVSIAITPSSPSVVEGASLQLTATGTFSDGSTQNLTGAVTWTATGGSVSSTGFFTAPATASSITVTATSVSSTVSGSTTIAVTGGATSMQQLATDNFNRQNASTLGVNWTPLIGNPANTALQILNGQVESIVAAPQIGKEMYYGGLNWPADQYSEVTIVAMNSAGNEGPAVRMTSNDMAYLCSVNSLGTGDSSVSILLFNAGTTTTLASSTTATVLAGQIVSCTVQGAVLTMENQSTGIPLLTAYDATLPSGYPGLAITAVTPSANVLGNWSAGASGPSLSLHQVASDNFSRANALNLGANWHIGTGHGPIQIVSDQVQPYPAGGPQPSKEHYVASGAFPNDQWSQMQVVFEDTVGDCGVELRASDSADTLYVADVNITGAAGTAETRISLVINGVITPLVIDQQWSAVASGDFIRGQAQGNLISLIDVTTGSLLLTAFDSNVTSGYPGISLQAVTGNPSDHIAGSWSGGIFQ
jgi:hypothetical protein